MTQKKQDLKVQYSDLPFFSAMFAHFAFHVLESFSIIMMTFKMYVNISVNIIIPPTTVYLVVGNQKYCVN